MREALVAHVALKRTFARVRPQVVRQVVPSGELFVANAALVWLLTRVR